MSDHNPLTLKLNLREKIAYGMGDVGSNLMLCIGTLYLLKFYTDEIVDSTGSGDAFNGAFLHGMNSGMTAFEAAKLASIDAGLQCHGMGAIKSTPYKDAVYSAYYGA